MDSKLNYTAITEYSSAFTTKVLDECFSNQIMLNGEGLLKLSPVKQVNLFVVKILFEKWQEEIKRLDSPYFNYQSGEVKAVIEQFKNTLSRNILVNRENISPLLEQAVYDTILLIFSPYHYFHRELHKEDDNFVNVAQLTAAKKFTKINTVIHDRIIDGLSTKKGKAVSADEATLVLNEVLEKTDITPEDFAKYQSQFAAVLALNAGDIYGNAAPQQMPETVEEIPKDAIDIPEEEEPLVEETIEEAPQEEGLVEEPMMEEPLEDEPQMEEPEMEQPRTIDEDIHIVGEVENNRPENTPKEEHNTVTLNDTYQQPQKRALVDEHLEQPIQSIENAITLNQRFMFVNTLFGGDIEQFNKTITKLDGMDSLSYAKEYLNAHFEHWDKEEEEVIEFLEIMSRRFV